MAGSVNKVILVGNVGKDPEIRRTQDGRPIANLSLATSETWRDKATGERKEKTEWHRVVIFSEPLCKVVEQYVKKGSKLYIEGALQTRKWTDQSGAEKYSTEVVLQGFNGTLTMLDGAGGGRGASAGMQEERRRLRFGRRLRLGFRLEFERAAPRRQDRRRFEGRLRQGPRRRDSILVGAGNSRSASRPPARAWLLARCEFRFAELACKRDVVVVKTESACSFGAGNSRSASRGPARACRWRECEFRFAELACKRDVVVVKTESRPLRHPRPGTAKPGRRPGSSARLRRRRKSCTVIA